VLNTGFFMNEKVKATHTISIIERLASRDLNNLEKLFGLDVMKFTSMDIKLPNSKEWKDLFKKQINSRIDFVKKLNNRDKLPEDALSSLESLISKI
jgi:DNA-binding ferritin-like protein (Dps family)